MLELPEPQTLQAVLSGINPTIRPFILQQNPKTLSALEECARLISDTTTKSTSSIDKSLLEAVNDIKTQLSTLSTSVSHLQTSNVAAVQPAPAQSQPQFLPFRPTSSVVPTRQNYYMRSNQQYNSFQQSRQQRPRSQVFRHHIIRYKLLSSSEFHLSNLSVHITFSFVL